MANSWLGERDKLLRQEKQYVKRHKQQSKYEGIQKNRIIYEIGGVGWREEYEY